MELAKEKEEPRRRRMQQQQRQVIRWERFLPRRSLRVLLVENDDSTRHIVAALLRKCSYNVAAVADGVKAWAALQEKHFKIDIVLSEVDMPSLSGIDFLDKVTNCDLSRDIPVIMMSSQDSVNVVFKCMLKGAVDFLVKPVRRNELRNLWQHVWRKHCARCNNPVERVDDGQTNPQDASGNDVAINYDNSCADGAHKNKDSSDDVRDTQSSCSKPENEARKVQKCAELGSTVVKDSLGEKMEKPCDGKVVIENSTKQDVRNKRGKEMGTARKEGICVKKNPEGTSSEIRGVIRESDRLSCMKENSGFGEEIGGNFYSSMPLYMVPNAQSAHPIDFIGSPANGHHACNTLEKDDHGNDNNKVSDTLLSQGIFVKRTINGFSNQGSQERHILKHSSASAFSRYGKDQIKSGTPLATLCISPKESTTKVQLSATQKEEVSSFPARSLALSAGQETYIPRNHQVTSASRNNGLINIKTRPPVESSSYSQNDEHDVNHTLNQASHNGVVTYRPGQIELMPYPFPVGQMPIQNMYAGYGAILQPTMYSEPSPSAPTIVRTVKEVAPSDHLGHQGNRRSYDLSSQQNCIQYHLEDERKENRIDRDQRQLEVHISTEVGEQADQHNHCNGHLSFRGEDNGVANITEYPGSVLKTTHQGNEDGFQNANGNCLDSGRSRREVAVMKFRQKRKERCFEKKVRYHSRKMLAEQRPRIKGQFVRISTVEPNTTTGEND